MAADLSQVPQDIQDDLADLETKFQQHQVDRTATQAAAAKLDATQADAAAKVAADQSALATCQAAEQHSGSAVNAALETLKVALELEFSDAPPTPATPTPGTAG